MDNKKQKISGDGICVFFRAYNDIDHITPILYKIKTLTKSIEISVILLEFKTDLTNDYRLKFLSSLGIKIIHLDELNIYSQYFNSVYKKIKTISFSLKSYSLLNSLMKKIVRYYEKIINEKIAKIDPDSFLENNFSNYPKLFIFDQGNFAFYKNLINVLKEKNIISIAVPHGHTILANELHYDSHMEITPGKSPYDVSLFPAKFDFTIFENNEIAQRYVNYGFLNNSNLKILGSARFSDEWMKQIPKIIDVQDIGFGKDKKLKIAFMLSKITYNGFLAEIHRTIEFITRFEEVFLIVKPHTRYKNINPIFKENIYVDNHHNFHSPSLIQWADLVIFEHSCICFHALKLDKPILYLSSTHANRLMSEKYLISWEAKCRDDIRTTILNMLKNKNHRTYDIKEGERFMTDIIEPTGKDVLNNYAKFILGLTNYEFKNI